MIDQKPVYSDEAHPDCSYFKTTELSEHFSNLEGLKELWAKRELLKTQLAQRLEEEGDYREAETLRGCNQPMGLTCMSCGHELAVRTSCRRRWCAVCSPLLAHNRAEKYSKAASLIRWPLHITLTVRNLRTIAQSDLKRLMAAFKKLRRTRLWKKCVKGGIVALEVTNRGKGWHPHLHILADCEWLALTTDYPRAHYSAERKASIFAASTRELQDAWGKCVGQLRPSTKIVRRAAADVVREVLKYAVKGSDLLECQGRAADVIAAMRRCRLMTPFGNLYGMKQELKEEPREPCKCAGCGDVKSYLPSEMADNQTWYAGKKNAGKRIERDIRKACRTGVSVA